MDKKIVTLSPVEYFTAEYSTFKTFEKTLIKINLEPPQTSKKIYSKLNNSEKVFEEFQRLTPFPRKMVLYSLTKFRILKPWTIISKLIRFDLSFWQTSKQVYRKLEYRENLLEEFLYLPHFPRKIVLYSSIKFGILKSWTIISKFIRFDLGLWQTLKQVYRKLKYRKKVLEDFQRLPLFSRKNILYSPTKFGILKPWTSISKLIRFDLGFWQTSKQIYRKLKCREKVLKKFQRLPHFPRKMVLYSSTKLGILKPWTIISKLIKIHLGFWQTSK